MKTNKRKKQIEDVKKRLLQIGEMRPGSLSKQYSVCGKKNCRCIDPKKPKKHGPYYQLSFTHKGKSSSRFIRPQLYNKIKGEVAEYNKFKLLIEKWIELAILLSEEKIAEERLVKNEKSD